MKITVKQKFKRGLKGTELKKFTFENVVEICVDNLIWIDYIEDGILKHIAYYADEYTANIEC